MKGLIEALVGVVFVFGGLGQANGAAWTINRVTDNTYDDIDPQVSGGNVVWQGYDGNDYEIFRYDGTTTRQLTDNSYQDMDARVSGQNVAWVSYDGNDEEIFFYDGTTTMRLTNNDYQDLDVHVDGSNIVWRNGTWGQGGISFCHGGTITELRGSYGCCNYAPHVSGSTVVWQAGGAPDYDIFLYDGSSITQLTDDTHRERVPKISGSKVVWSGNDYGSGTEIFLYDGTISTRLTHNDYQDDYAQISGSNVVWQGYDGNDYEVFLYDGNTTKQVTDNMFEDEYPQVCGSIAVWQGYDGNDYEIFLYTGTTTRQLTENDYDDISPQVDGLSVVWQGHDGNDHEIFQVTLPEASILARHIFYNNSVFDLDLLGRSDDDAIAPDKVALLPGQAATFENYTSYSKGVNGIIIDIADLPEGATLDTDDFWFKVGNDDTPDNWDDALNPISVTVRPGEGIQQSDRVTIIWDENVIQKEWLQITVLANKDTGLLEDDVFYFGNAIGESGNATTDAKVNAYDMLGARDNQRTFSDPAQIDFPFDYDRDARVNAYDMLTARDNHTHFMSALEMITAPGRKGTIPEPPTLALLGMGALGLLAYLWRERRRR